MAMQYRQSALWCSTLIGLLVGCSSPTRGLWETAVPPGTELDAGVDAGYFGDAATAPDVAVVTDAGTARDASPPDIGEVPVPPRFVQVVVGREHSCALGDDGQVWCWGSDLYGQLGQGLQHRHECGTADWKAPCRGWAERVPDLAGAKAIAADQRRTCALMQDGQVRCLGSAPISLPGLPALNQISMSRRGLHGVDDSGAVWWSRYWLQAERVEGVESAIQVASGDKHACAMSDDGSVKCWGSNFHAQLGVPETPACSHTCDPVSVTLPGPAEEVAAGEAHSCARLDNATVVCWGQVGEQQSAAPHHVRELDGATALTSGPAGVVCGRVANGNFRCVAPPTLQFNPESLGPASQLALSHDWFYTDPRVRTVPHDDQNGYVYSDGDRRRLQGRSHHGCALRPDGTIACAGADYAGQLASGGWDASIHGPATIVTGPAAVPPPPGDNDPRWARLHAMPEHCPIEVARDPTTVAVPRWEPCAFELNGCRALFTPGFSVSRGWHDGERGYFSMRSIGTPPDSGDRRITAVATTDLDVIAAWAGPYLQFWCNEPPYAPRCAPRTDYAFNCRVADVVFGEDHLAVSLWTGPWPTRVVHVPIAEAGSRRVPTFPTAFPLAAAVSRTTVAFGNGGVPVVENGQTVVSAPNYARHLNARRGLLLFGQDVLWWEQPGELIAGSAGGLAVPLISSIQSFATDGRDLVWFEPTPTPGSGAQVWTSPHVVQSPLIAPRPIGPAGGPFGGPTNSVVGSGHVAWMQREQDGFSDVIVLDLADGTRRRFHVPYHRDASHSQLVRPLYVTESELFVSTNGATIAGVSYENRVYSVPIRELPVEPAGP